MPAVASCAPLPYVDACTVAHVVVRAGMPPSDMSPGFHVVARSGGKIELAPTYTVAVAVTDGSAWLVATTWHVASPSGATYAPVASIVPQLASAIDHATAVSSVPVTVAVNATDCPDASDATAGAMSIAMPLPPASSPLFEDGWLQATSASANAISLIGIE